MNVLIIEDEINAYEYLERLISQLKPSHKIIGHIDGVQDAINWFHNNEMPDLIFMDIQLSDGISFEIFNHVDITAPIVFTTAYDEFALQAFKVNSIDYLLKPITKDALSAAYIQFENQRDGSINHNYSKMLDALPKETKNRFLVKKGNHFEFISVDDIMYIYSDDSLTFLFTSNGQRHIYGKSIQELVQSLDPASFFQINRKQVVNIKSIKKIHPFLNQRLKLDIAGSGDVEFIVSRNRMTEFKSWVDS